MQTPEISAIEAFYRAGLEGLGFLEQREGRGRRFGEAAHAAWRSLGGELEAPDRVELLLRDAAANYPLAFGARGVFEMTWLAEDEPFGSEWPPVRAALAESLLRESKSGGATDVAELLAAAAGHWGLPKPTRTPALTDQVARITPASHFLVAGVSAMLAIITATSTRRDLDLAEQALVLTSGAAERQLWGLSLLAASTRTRPRVLSLAHASADAVRGLGLSRLDFSLVGQDTTAEQRSLATALSGALRG
jgi:hypothetical protein